MWNVDDLRRQHDRNRAQSERARAWWTDERRAIARGVTKRRHLRERAELEAEIEGWDWCAWPRRDD